MSTEPPILPAASNALGSAANADPRPQPCAERDTRSAAPASDTGAPVAAPSTPAAPAADSRTQPCAERDPRTIVAPAPAADSRPHLRAVRDIQVVSAAAVDAHEPAAPAAPDLPPQPCAERDTQAVLAPASTPAAPAAAAPAAPDPQVRPFLKWVGGKRQLMPSLQALLPPVLNRYFEPFLGGGALLFHIQPAVALVNDTNAELINCYEVIRDQPDDLLAEAARHTNTSEYFYEVRDLDRNPLYAHLSKVQRAARILYLNKTCYNGLFRVNRRGEFNAPFGAYKNPVIADPGVIRAVSRYLKSAQVEICNRDFAASVQDAERGDFVYFDPPYDPVSDTASFTGYCNGGFGRDEQLRLKETCDALTARGVKVLLSNSDTPFIRSLYAAPQYEIRAVQARRNINSVATGRGMVGEVFVLNYAP